MVDVHLRHIDYVHIKVETEPGILMELAEHLTFFAPNYKYSPKFKAKVWDGRISCINRLSGYCFAGLAQKIKKFCDSRNYSISFDTELYYDNISRKELQDHVDTLHLPSAITPREYQFESVLKCIKSKRRLLLSPTSSGKSLIIYLIGSWYKREKKLIIVPTAGLVAQFEGDLRDYGFKGDIVTSVGGLSKDNDIKSDYVITTWQSLNNGKTKMPKQWYSQFDCVFGDEAHGSSAACVKEILSNMNHCQYRFGTTGTLSDDGLSNATIEGLFGPQYRSISTEEMIKKNYASKLKIKCLVLKYETDVIQDLRSKFNEIDKTAKSKGSQKYAAEIELITNNPARNKFLKNLILSLNGNRLVFFKMLEHGRLLLETLSEEQEHVYHIDGSVSATKREQIRKDLEENENCILLGSLGTVSTGVNIKRLHHMIAASPSKSKIKVLQSIGRMLRLHSEKEESGAVLYDIVDDLSAGSFKNYALAHFIDRCKIYDAEAFDYEIYSIKIKSI